MRILMLTHNLAGTGGSFMRAWGLGRGLAQRGHQVTLLAGRRRNGPRLLETWEGGLRLIQVADWFPRRARHGGLSPFDVAGRWIWLANQPFDVLHAFDHRPAVSIPSLLYRGRSRVPLVVDWADLWGVEGIAGRRSTALRHTLGRLDTWGERRFHQTADLVTPINAELARRTLDLGVPADRVVVILPGAPVDLIQPQVKQNARRALGLDSAAHVLVYIGYAPYDQDLVLDAFRQLADQDSLAQLITAGGPFVGGDKNTLPARLAARHRHLGEVPYNRLETLLGAGDLMLLPFRDTPVNRGRYPNKLGDYLAAGRPVLTNPTGELGRLVDQEGIGKLAAESGAAMAAGARELLQDPGQLEELGRRARLLAERRWGWVHRAATAETAYLRLMG